MTRKKIFPPSRAGRGSRFITARFTAIMAARYAIFRTAAAVEPLFWPTSVMTVTMPTGPLMSLTPAWPVNSICSDRRTMRTKSAALAKLICSRSPRVVSFTVKFSP